MNDNTDRSIAVDFDGTVVEFAYPAIGKPVPGAIESLRFLHRKGIRVILWTCRTGRYLDDAIDYMTRHVGVSLFGANGRPEQPGWPAGPKVFATTYIDDAALGCPLRPASEGFRPVVDWRAVMHLLDAVFPGEGLAEFAATLPDGKPVPVIPQPKPGTRTGNPKRNPVSLQNDQADRSEP